MPQVGELRGPDGKASQQLEGGIPGTTGICTDIGLRGRASPASMGRHSEAGDSSFASTPENMGSLPVAFGGAGGEDWVS